MKRPIIALSALTLLLLTACEEAPPVPGELAAIELGSTRNVHRMGDIIFAGQPALGDWEAVTNLNVRTVVNLRHARENKEFNEEEIAGENGLAFVRIPFASADELSDEVIENVREQLNSASQPLLLHCASANRVGAVWIPFRVLDQGIPYEQALAEAKQIGLRSAAYQKRIEQYLQMEE